MQPLYDTSAPKKPTNLSVNSDLLLRIKDMGINISATLEKALITELKKAEAERWAKENKKAIKKYNDFIEEHGCFGDEFRSF
ncbi:MAG: type II toxin-antitoxin system CcdA family antitoxin [Hahellaceae bacterium]|nr:type II toxin-antitoxin system CcdA family antitoxin [Hahellaceae bacterium]MCP5170596.1 type II toxin-antitoxin system CcdA family antitoxin [Hahellaceae bacterium]